MNAFSFEQFDVTEGNRQAFEACRDVAALRYAGPRPVLLLGPEGSGKTHLLWSIVKRVRASAVQSSLALVMAREFPDRVKDLVRDPAPIRGKPAIFLVDELERFDRTAQDLEAVVRLFLEHGHQVVLASNVHPDRLANLNREFKTLLRAGRMIELGPRPAASAAASQEAGSARKDKDSDLLRAALKQVKQDSDAVREESAALRAQLEEIRGERDALEGKLAEKAALAAELAQLKDQCVAREAEIARLHEEMGGLQERAAIQEAERIAEHAAALAACEAERNGALDACANLEKELAAAAAAAAHLPEVETRLRHTEEEAAAAFANVARLQGQIGVLKMAADRVASLEAERDEALERLAEFQERAEALYHHSVARGHVWAASYKTLRERISGLLESVAGGLTPMDRDKMSAALEAARQELDALREQWREDHDTLDSELQRTHSESDVADELLQVAQAERGRLQVAFDAAQARLQVVENELESMRRRCAVQSAEMDALRQAAAGRAASASVQAGELDNRIRQLEYGLDLARETGSAVGGRLYDLNGRLTGAFEELQALVQQLDALRIAAREQVWEGPGAEPQAFLFELGGDTPAPDLAAPGDAATLFRQVVEDAMSDVPEDGQAPHD